MKRKILDLKPFWNTWITEIDEPETQIEYEEPLYFHKIQAIGRSVDGAYIQIEYKGMECTMTIRKKEIKRFEKWFSDCNIKLDLVHDSIGRK